MEEHPPLRPLKTCPATRATVRFARILLLSLAVGAFAAPPVGTASAQPSCGAGWNLVAEYDNSFSWQGPGTDFAQWDGSVQVWKDLAADCTVLRLWILFSGPGDGGTVTLVGEQIGFTFSIQYPEPFVLYADAPINAYGEGAHWNPPDGYYDTYYAHMHYDINERGAEEYWVGALPPDWSAVVTPVYAAFDLPLELIGHTVYAQVHVYPDRCQCTVTEIPIPADGAPEEPSCESGWNLVAEYDNSFSWEGFLEFAQWEGSVEVWKELAADCTVLRMWIMFAGPGSGGTVTLVGTEIGLTFTIQYPEPFVLYADAPINAYGEGAHWNPPDGYYDTYYAHMHYDINERGAEEYWIGTLPPLWSAHVTDVYAAFDLPVEFIGHTVYAQVHVYPDRCQCGVTEIAIP